MACASFSRLPSATFFCNSRIARGTLDISPPTARGWVFAGRLAVNFGLPGPSGDDGPPRSTHSSDDAALSLSWRVASTAGITPTGAYGACRRRRTLDADRPPDRPIPRAPPCASSPRPVVAGRPRARRRSGSGDAVQSRASLPATPCLRPARPPRPARTSCSPGARDGCPAPSSRCPSAARGRGSSQRSGEQHQTRGAAMPMPFASAVAR
jgi:hypothetical protein